MNRPRIVTVDDPLRAPNPFWSAEANRAAEANPEGLTPRQLADRWSHLRHAANGDSPRP